MACIVLNADREPGSKNTGRAALPLRYTDTGPAELRVNYSKPDRMNVYVLHDPPLRPRLDAAVAPLG